MPAHKGFNWKLVAILLSVVWLGWLLAFRFSDAAPLLSGETKILDLRVVYERDEAIAFRDAFLAGEGKLASAYETFTMLDRVFPAIYALALVAWARALRSGVAPQFVAFAAAVIDWSENAAVSHFLSSGDLGYALELTLAKFVSFLAAIALIVLGAWRSRA